MNRTIYPVTGHDYSFVEDFDPECTGDLVLVKVFQILKTYVGDKRVRDVACLAVQRIFHLRNPSFATNSTKGNNRNHNSNNEMVLRSFQNLGMHSSQHHTNTTDVNDIANTFANMGFQKPMDHAFACVQRINHHDGMGSFRELTLGIVGRDVLPVVNAGFPGICLANGLSDLLNAIYSTVSDALYPVHTNHAVSLGFSECINVYVVTHLQLCGGLPGQAVALPIPLPSDMEGLVTAIKLVHDQSRRRQPRRLGGMSDECLERGNWLYQSASTLSELSEDENTWFHLEEHSLHKVMEAQRSVTGFGNMGKHIFIMNSTQKSIPARIHSKLLRLQSAPHLIHWTPYNHAEATSAHTKSKDQAELPCEFLPPSDPDLIPVYTPSSLTDQSLGPALVSTYAPAAFSFPYLNIALFPTLASSNAPVIDQAARGLAKKIAKAEAKQKAKRQRQKEKSANETTGYLIRRRAWGTTGDSYRTSKRKVGERVNFKQSKRPNANTRLEMIKGGEPDAGEELQQGQQEEEFRLPELMDYGQQLEQLMQRNKKEKEQAAKDQQDEDMEVDEW